MNHIKEVPVNKTYIRLKDHKFKIRKHPYYISLKKNKPTIFNNFMKNYNSYQRTKKTGNWYGFKKLVKSIDKKGFIYNRDNPIIISKKHDKWIITHGRHRACVLYFLYGAEAVFHTKKIEKNRYNIISIH
jgi:hypothetical protein